MNPDMLGTAASHERRRSSKSSSKSPTAPPGKKAAFKASKLTSTAFAINEHSDAYDEKPLIYAKLVPAARTLLLVDTGCGGATSDGEISVRGLREFIETVPVQDNSGRPLNPGAALRYVLVLTHCHYDHIRT